MAVSLATLLVQETKAVIYTKAINIARAVGLPVDSWQTGDPTRSLYHLESEVLEALERVAVGFIRSAFLDPSAEEATSDPAARTWLKVNADQTYGVTVPEPTYATTDVILTNNGGGLYTEDDLAPGSVTFKNSTSEKTYRNTTTGTLASGPGTTVTLTVVADEPGSESSAAAGEIDELVTNLLGVTCTNPTAAIGLDEQDPATTVAQCRAKLDFLSPAKGAYAFVARNPELTGTTAVTRVRPYTDSDFGDVIVILAGPSGGVAEPDRAAVEEAVLENCTPLCITPTVLSAIPKVVPVTYQLWLYKSVNKTVAEIEEDVEAALEQMFATREIGGDIIPPATLGGGKLYTSLIESTIRSVFPADAFRVVVTSPAADVALAYNEVATLGAVTASVTIVVRT